MEIAYETICINPDFPVKQAGFLQQTKPVFRFHDDLHARILLLREEDSLNVIIACDVLGFPYPFQHELEQVLSRTYADMHVHVTVCGTHTHFAPDPEDPRFQAEVMNSILSSIHQANYHSGPFSLSLTSVPFTGVGKSRITGHEADVLLQQLVIYEKDEPWIRILIHNCHPTTQGADTPWFSADYPGYVINRLKDLHEEQEFMFLQSAAGDVSTRFTRTASDYANVKRLGMNLVDEVENLMEEKPDRIPLDHAEYQRKVLTIEHDLRLPENTGDREMSDREKSEIEIGRQVRSYISTHQERMHAYCLMSALHFGTYTIVFCPNEAFSWYLSCIDRSRSSLVCYSNGYQPYLMGPDQSFTTYECFLDTWSHETKLKFAEAIRELDKKLN